MRTRVMRLGVKAIDFGPYAAVELEPVRAGSGVKGVPAALLATCATCGAGSRRSELHEFDGAQLCEGCFDLALETAGATMKALLQEKSESDRLCSNCRAMIDPGVSSAWCGILELGATRAVLCDQFVPLTAPEAAASDNGVPHTPDADEMWHSIVSDLSETLGPTHLAWLEDTTGISLDHSVLRVSVSNDLARAWIVARLLPAITRLLEVNGYPDLTVEFETGSVGASSSTDNAYWPPNPRKRGSTVRSTQQVSESPAVLELVPAASKPALPPAISPCAFNPAFTFDRFVVGTGNRLAHAGALAVADNMSRKYNPLFLHGEVGVGKTHLLQAIGSRWNSRNQVVAYVTSETFTNELVSSIRSGKTREFREQYREIDILLIDDIHFICGKEATQEEFFHTFDALYNSRKQIVITSDRPPHEMRTLEERLRSRFAWGLIADIQAPDFLTKLEILRARALERGVTMEEEALEVLASQPTTNVRELEGQLNRLLLLADVHGMAPNQQLATSLLYTKAGRDRISADDVIRAVTAYFRVTTSSLCGQMRSREVTRPRHIAMFLLREEAKLSLPNIGVKLGGRDHSTVIYGCEKIKRESKSNSQLQSDIEAIRGLLSGRLA